MFTNNNEMSVHDVDAEVGRSDQTVVVANPFASDARITVVDRYGMPLRHFNPSVAVVAKHDPIVECRQVDDRIP